MQGERGLRPPTLPPARQGLSCSACLRLQRLLQVGAQSWCSCLMDRPQGGVMASAAARVGACFRGGLPSDPGLAQHLRPGRQRQPQCWSGVTWCLCPQVWMEGLDSPDLQERSQDWPRFLSLPAHQCPCRQKAAFWGLLGPALQAQGSPRRPGGDPLPCPTHPTRWGLGSGRGFHSDPQPKLSAGHLELHGTSIQASNCPEA